MKHKIDTNNNLHFTIPTFRRYSFLEFQMRKSTFEEGDKIIISNKL